MKEISFISTDAKGTPFSFFNSIFWNNAIDLHSKQGQQIFNHEIAHVKEKHSYDKIFMNVVLIFFWINPFFWLIRKELSMIHEFIADKEALEDSDINAFAEMILQTVYPGQQFSITNNFFHSPLKRRLIMFTKNKNPKVTYVSRLLVLPLAAIVFFAFTLKMKTISLTNFYNGKTITVVIDAGHGGEDNGVVAADGLNEKDINLSIAKKIVKLNSNDHIKILLSRDDDKLIPVKERVEFAKSNHADLFISIHVNAADKNNPNENGISVFIDKNNTDKNKLLASALIHELKKSYTTEDLIGVRKSGVWVLDNNVCPAALIECGYLTYPADVAFITKNGNQEKIAKNILDGIETYAEQNVSVNIDQETIQDTVPPSTVMNKLTVSSNILYVADGKIVPKEEAMAIDPNDIQSVNVLKDESAKKLYGEKGKNGVVIITKKSKMVPGTTGEKNSKPEPIYFVDGKEISKDEMKTISPSSIESMSIFKDGSAIEKYGEKGKNGVIEIITKGKEKVNDNNNNTNQNPPPPPPPEATSVNFSLKKDKVDVVYGNGHVETLTKEEAINQGMLSRIVKDTMPDKVFTKVENEASFPGGYDAWVQYVTSKIKDSINVFTDKDYGTCLVKFIVNIDGSISNAEATTMKDSHLANTALYAIRTGPKWIPATQNGHTVNSYRLQPVTLTNPEKK